MFIGQFCRSSSQTRGMPDSDTGSSALLSQCRAQLCTAAHRTLSYHTAPTEGLPSHNSSGRTLPYHMTPTVITVPQLLPHDLAVPWLLQQDLTNCAVRYYHVMLLYKGVYISCFSNKENAMSHCSNRNSRNNS